MEFAIDPILREWLRDGLTAAALLAALLAAVGAWRRRRLVEELERTLDERLERLRTAFDGALRDGLQGVSRSQGEVALQITGRMDETRSQLLESLSSRFREVQQAQEGTLSAARRSQDERLDKVEAALTGFTGSFHKAVGELENKLLAAAKAQSEQAAASADAVQQRLARTLAELGEKQSESLGKLQDKVATELGQVRKDSEAKLEQIRATVDEKLHSTLEKRLGDSFRLVSERLELVHKGLGEMQNLASGVGDLKRVLTNVRSRGTFGEVQLEALLEQVLTPGQYDKNVATVPGSSERVEFAIRLPGRDGESSVVHLPIDAKFPQEDYLRLQEAYETGDLVALEESRKALRTRIAAEAKTICAKYLSPPHTTDFALLFVPTEGLYAEALRLPGLVEDLQQGCRVVLAGPTTLYAVLNSLQMGFQTLAIERRSSEVWKVLGAIKTEFGRFGDSLAAVKKKLQEASNKIEASETRTRVMERKLRDVEELPQAEAVLHLPDLAAGQGLVDEEDAGDPP